MNLKVREHVGVVSNEERVGHVGQLLRVLLGYLRRGGLLVRDDVVHEGSPTGTWVPQPHGLRGEDGGGHLKKKNLHSIPHSFG